MPGIPSIGSFTTMPSGIMVPAGPDVVQAPANGGGGGPAGQLLVHDTFTEIFSTKPLGDHIPDVDVIGTGWDVKGNFPTDLRANLDDYLYVLNSATKAGIDVGTDNIDVQVTYTPLGAAGGFWVLAMDGDPANAVYIFFHWASNIIWLYDALAGTVELDSMVPNLVQGTPYVFRMTVNGLEVKAYQDGSEILSGTIVGTKAGTEAGLGLWESNNDRMDDFTVYDFGARP